MNIPSPDFNSGDMMNNMLLAMFDKYYGQHITVEDGHFNDLKTEYFTDQDKIIFSKTHRTIEGKLDGSLEDLVEEVKKNIDNINSDTKLSEEEKKSRGQLMGHLINKLSIAINDRDK